MEQEITIVKLGPGEVDLFTGVVRLFREVFETSGEIPPRTHLGSVLAKDGFYVFTALRHGKVIGGLTAYTLDQYYDTAPLVYIYDLAVAAEWQRKGVGNMLVQSLKEFCIEKGVTEIFVQADNEDVHALDFYRATGGRAEKVVHFTYPLGTN